MVMQMGSSKSFNK